ncbi:hypothetical protein HHI36_004491 [Cryptolaemus montrouzieri]|uniref:Netrin receptor UNC5A-D-like N-terminal domain-containing protein n=1 Tax=Cryptolaemus montrouzieri TaxID=559131 RepID=A0ABD2NRC3_9CUCU
MLISLKPQPETKNSTNENELRVDLHENYNFDEFQDVGKNMEWNGDYSSFNSKEGLLEETAATKATLEHDDSILLSSDSLPIFQVEPQNAYVVKSRPALLQCKAGNALRAFFKCNGAKNVESTQSEFVHPQTGVRIIEAEINITRDMVEEFFGNEKFKCECHAWSGSGSIKSHSAIVDVACAITWGIYYLRSAHSEPYNSHYSKVVKHNRHKADT